jgi:hypothetical protein
MRVLRMAKTFPKPDDRLLPRDRPADKHESAAARTQTCQVRHAEWQASAPATGARSGRK